jgi:predicted AlkP superfamily phosphohydrolase/phosphomutase
MSLLDHFKKKRQRVFVLGVDGTPFSLINDLVSMGELPVISKVLEEGTFREIHSVIPPISSVAWASYMTGKNPGKHNIYGFVDRNPASLQLFLPNSTHMQSETLWEILSNNGKKVVVLNVPLTYPPRKVNGILVAGFDAPSVEKATFPREFAERLKRMNYRLDIDPWEARKSKDTFLDDLHHTTGVRKKLLFELMDECEWDFFQLHVMGTDRLHHFLWEFWEHRDPVYGQAFLNFYHWLDRLVGDIYERLDGETTFIMLSDHGFCTLKKEVNLNFWLEEGKFLKFENESHRELPALSGDTVAYSQIPGRIYINLRGREAKGRISPGSEYERMCDEIAQFLESLVDPETNGRIIQRVYRRDEIYHGRCLSGAPDLVALPVNGYDLKASFEKKSPMMKGPIVGMHTYDNALYFIRGEGEGGNERGIVDIMGTILDIFNIRAHDLDSSY